MQIHFNNAWFHPRYHGWHDWRLLSIRGVIREPYRIYSTLVPPVPVGLTRPIGAPLFSIQLFETQGIKLRIQLYKMIPCKIFCNI